MYLIEPHAAKTRLALPWINKPGTTGISLHKQFIESATPHTSSSGGIFYSMVFDWRARPLGSPPHM